MGVKSTMEENKKYRDHNTDVENINNIFFQISSID